MARKLRPFEWPGRAGAILKVKWDTRRVQSREVIDPPEHFETPRTAALASRLEVFAAPALFAKGAACVPNGFAGTERQGPACSNQGRCVSARGRMNCRLRAFFLWLYRL